MVSICFGKYGEGKQLYIIQVEAYRKKVISIHRNGLICRERNGALFRTVAVAVHISPIRGAIGREGIAIIRIGRWWVVTLGDAGCTEQQEEREGLGEHHFDWARDRKKPKNRKRLCDLSNQNF